MLNQTDFIRYDEGGRMSHIFCKVCGERIAGLVDRPRGSGPDLRRTIERFMRFANYTEAKFEFNDGSFHVTSGCKNCLHGKISTGLMLEMYQADMAEMNMTPGLRKPIAVVKVQPGGGIE